VLELLTLPRRRHRGVCVRHAWRYAASQKFRGSIWRRSVDCPCDTLITLSHKGAPFAAVEGRSMIMGAFALATYSWVVCVMLKKYLLSSWTATAAAMVLVRGRARWFRSPLSDPWIVSSTLPPFVRLFGMSSSSDSCWAAR
jgi:hypothetical protein